MFLKATSQRQVSVKENGQLVANFAITMRSLASLVRVVPVGQEGEEL